MDSCTTAFETFLFIKMPGKAETSLESSTESMYHTIYWEMTVAKILPFHFSNFDEFEMIHITSGTV